MDLRPGQELPSFARPSDLGLWNRFAAVNDEFFPTHMDDAAGRAAGYPSSFAMGNLQWSYLHNLLRGWLPPGGRIVELACQFRDASLRGETVTARGRIESVEGTIVRLGVWTEAPDGRRLALGTATVELPS